MVDTIPFSFLPAHMMADFAKPFMGVGYIINKQFPFLARDLRQADIHLNVEVYGSVIFLNALIYFVVFSVVAGLVLSKLVITTIQLGPLSLPSWFVLGIVIGFIFALLLFTQMLAYPNIRVKKRIREIEVNLVYALRTMLVQLKSGVTLFDSIRLIAMSGKYGRLGVEFKQAVDEIQSGMREDIALQQIADDNPSPYLRKIVWQVVNGMRAGADTSDVLAESVSTITREQQIAIKEYESSLRVLSLVYLMIGIIIPALGLTLLIVIGSFPRIQVTELFFWALAGLMIISEFMFIGMLKAKRPGLMS